MKVICQYCHTVVRAIDDGHDEAVSHGVCQACLPRLLEDCALSIPEYLDTLATPVLLVHGDARLVAANAAARSFVARPRESVAGELAGNVIGCRHAREPGGCGGTVHCQSCTIRQSVERTYRTGEACTRVPAFTEVGLLSGERTISHTISTRMAGPVVLLEIESLESRPEARD